MPTDSAPCDDRLLKQAMFTASERDQRDIGESMHDTLCQTLGGAVLMVRVLATRLKEGSPIEAAEMDSLAEKLDRALDEARAISNRLQPVFPRADGLMTALARLADETSETTPCAFQCEDAILMENPEAAMTLYRVAQEAVKNAVAHSNASHIKISLVDPDGVIKVSVSDDGQGFPAGRAGQRIGGGEIMRCRAQAAGGTFTSDSESGHGTTVTCSVPKDHAHKQPDSDRPTPAG
jgi:two-component system, LuxR family, sensor kinase FixL